MGSFSHESGFDVRPEEDALLLKLMRPGDDRREVSIHLHYYLLADILAATAEVLTDQESQDEAHRERLQEAANALRAALGGGKARRRKKRP